MNVKVRILDFLKTHTLLAVYMIVFGGLVYGVYVTSGSTYLPEMGIYLIALLISYFLFQLKVVRSKLALLIQKMTGFTVKMNVLYVLIPALLFVIYHFIYLGGSPALQGLSMHYIEEVALLRFSITENLPTFLAYGSSIILKAVLPFSLLYFLHKGQMKFYWLLLLISVFYSFSLMQKSYVVGLLLPSLIYVVAHRKWWFVAKYMAIMIFVVVGLAFIANPPGGSNGMIVGQKQPVMLNEEPVHVIDEPTYDQSKYSKLELIVYGLIDRLTVVPGDVVTGWFKAIPAKRPFLYGDGYRILAKLRGREYRNYSIELYPILQPQYAAQGLSGSVNVASFMYEYANFGRAGLVLSGIILALLFIVVELCFENDFIMKLSFNLFSVLLLSSGAITTLLFSNGWGFLILFYLLFLKRTVKS